MSRLSRKFYISKQCLNIGLIVLIIISTGCASTLPKETLEKYNLSIQEDGYLTKPFIVKVEDSIINATEVIFENSKSSFVTKKALYSRFGKWDRTLYDSGKKHPILIWDDQKLIENEGKTYTIFTDGVEDTEIVYGSIIILGTNGLDALNERSNERNILLSRVKKWIVSDIESEEFYKDYWTLVDPEKAKRLGF